MDNEKLTIKQALKNLVPLALVLLGLVILPVILLFWLGDLADMFNFFDGK